MNQPKHIRDLIHDYDREYRFAMAVCGWLSNEALRQIQIDLAEHTDAQSIVMREAAKARYLGRQVDGA